MTDLLASEQKAVELFNRLGREGVESRISEIGLITDSREKHFHTVNPSLSMLFQSTHFIEDAEAEEMHLLKLGLMLCTNPAQEARQRNLKRIAERRAKRKQL